MVAAFTTGHHVPLAVSLYSLIRAWENIPQLWSLVFTFRHNGHINYPVATQSFVCIHKRLKSNMHTVGLPYIGSERRLALRVMNTT